MTFKTSLLAATAALALSATAAHAADFGNTILTYGHDNWDKGVEGAPEASWARGDTAFDLYGFDAEAGVTYGAIGADNPSLGVSAGLGKTFGDATIGAFYDRVTMKDGDMKAVQHYGAKVGYEVAGFDLEGFAGWGDFDGEETKVRGASVHRDLGKGFDAGFFYSQETIEDANFDYREKGMSVGYTATVLPRDLHVNAYVSQADIEGFFVEDMKNVGFTLSVPLGKDGETAKGRVRPHEYSNFYNLFGYTGETFF
jgi:hypothetical protein